MSTKLQGTWEFSQGNRGTSGNLTGNKGTCTPPKRPSSFDQGVMTYKILHDLCPENLRHKFTERSIISEYRTRNHGDLQIPKVRLEYAKRSFYFSGVKTWNDIPDNIRERDSIARFRTGLRDYLLNLSQDPNTTPW